MLLRDPPDHTRLRSLVNKAFTPRAVASLEERIAKITHQRLDQVTHRGAMELMSEFAYPIPALVICELMGVPSSDHELIILSGLITAEQDGDRLGHDELVAMALLLLIAGHETTANLIGNGLLALLSNPGQWRRFGEDDTLDRSTVEELLRFDGPIQMVERIALADVDVGMAHIPKGRIAVLCIAAANRDPAVFAQPDVLDIGRDPNPHLGFGGGAHFCLGALLARLEARIALRALAERLPGLSIATRTPKWRPSFTIRGLRELPLSWDRP